MILLACVEVCSEDEILKAGEKVIKKLKTSNL